MHCTGIKPICSICFRWSLVSPEHHVKLQYAQILLRELRIGIYLGNTTLRSQGHTNCRQLLSAFNHHSKFVISCRQPDGIIVHKKDTDAQTTIGFMKVKDASHHNNSDKVKVGLGIFGKNAIDTYNAKDDVLPHAKKVQ